MKQNRLKRVAGFSVMEAIIVLAITGLALTLVFSIGSRASEMGFRLGRRALGVADTQIANDSFRSLINGLVLPPYDMPKDLSGGEDVAFHGDAHEVSGRLVAARATPCADAGPAGQVALAIRSSGGHTVLQCSVGGRPPILVADLGVLPASFSYSADGASFVDQWSALPGIPATGDPGPAAQYRRVYVRLANTDGSVQMLAIADSGRTVTWLVFDPQRAF